MVELTDDLVKEFEPLIKKIARYVHARSHKSSCLDIEDLESVGYMGLMQACRSYINNKETSFKTFAGYRIKGSMLDELRKVMKFNRRTRTSHGEHLGFDDFRSDLLNDGTEVTFLNLVSSDDEFFDPDRDDVFKDIQKALKFLSKRDRIIFDLYFFRDLQQAEVGAQLNISETRVCQIIAKQGKELKKLLQDYRSAVVVPDHKYVESVLKTSQTKEKIVKKERSSRRGMMYSKNGKLEKATVLLDEGFGIRAVHRKTGMAIATVSKAYHRLVQNRKEKGLGPPLCACGNLSTHIGWCSHRFKLSSSRQTVVENFHKLEKEIEV